MTSCELLDSDCLTTFSGPSLELYMGGADDFDVFYYRNIPSGYSHEVCIKCQQNDYTPDGTLFHQIEVTDLWKITQTMEDGYCD